MASEFTVIIPMRAGSKGVPRKNLRSLAGTPLYRHSVDHALNLDASRIIVSTDIPTSELNLPGGVEVLRRPSQLADDDTKMSDVITHAVASCGIAGKVLLLQPTSPIRLLASSLECLAMLSDPHEDAMVMSVSLADRSVLKWGTIGPDGTFSSLAKDSSTCFANRQTLPQVYRPNGSLYAFYAERFAALSGFPTRKIYPLVLSPPYDVDVDTIEDFERCETILLSIKTIE